MICIKHRNRPYQFCRNLLLSLLLCRAYFAIAQDGSKRLSGTNLAPARWGEPSLDQQFSGPSAEYDYQYGIALAQRESWDEARRVLLAGSHLAPGDKRFPIELAGVAFKQKNNRRAIAYLRHALELDPTDAYANQFLATLYFLEGNLEAALKYWNFVGQPLIEQVRIEPALRVRPGLLDHAFAFAPESVLTLEEMRATEARLSQLDIFAGDRVDVMAQADEKFDAVFRAQELNGFGNGKVEAAVRLLRGLPFQEVDPEYFNFHGAAVNLTSQFRWDPDKRRASLAWSAPLVHDPRWRLQLQAGAREENWDLVTSFAGPAQLLGALNLRREEFSAAVTRLVGARWSWSAGAEVSHRDFRNVLLGIALTPELLARGYQLKQNARLRYELWHSVEHRFTLSGGTSFQAARLWAQSPESFSKVVGSMETHWLPQARGDDLETRWRLRAGKTFGEIPFDELWMLGLERDNDLWLRAHLGTRDGRKGSAPLGRDYFLSNWETDKNVFSNGVLGLKLGPFLDAGSIRDTASSLGSQKWLWDSGAQAKLRVLGLGVTFSYGKDLRSGNNAFYTTVSSPTRSRPAP